MGTAITSLLTDASVRDASSAEKTIVDQAKVAVPWNTALDQQ